MVEPQVLIIGIQAILRAAQAGADLYGERGRDRKVFLPNLELPTGPKSVQLQQFLKENQSLINDTPELSKIWNDSEKRLKDTSGELFDVAYTIMLQHKAKLKLISDGKDGNSASREADMLVAGHMVEQWRKERKPPSAVIRMALTLTDIGLEFVGSNPSILGISSRGEKLIVVFAKNMSVLIPDDVTAFGSKTDFADRVLGIFLRAGLGTLANNASIVFKDEDIVKLLKGVTKPIVEALPESIDEQISYRDLIDVLAGPSAEAAFKVLAENTESYLGKDFANDKALGALTSALFQEIRDTADDGSIVNVFSQEGLIRIYQSGLGVAVERPELFIGDDESVKHKLLRDLLSGSAATLQAYPRFKGPVGASFAAMVLEVVGHNAPMLLKFDSTKPWEKIAVEVLDQITVTLAETLKKLDDDKSLKSALRSFSDGQLIELGRVILTQVAETPDMLGIKRTEVKSIVKGMAEAMATDDNLLLSADEWIKIAGVAAQRAASNPGRLFGLSADDQGDAIAVTVIKSVLTVAGNKWTDKGRSDHPLLFGETLKTAMEEVIDALAGNVSAVTKKPDLVDKFMKELLTKASEKPEKFGSEGLLKVFRAFIGKVLAKGTLPTDQEIEKVLSA